MYVKVARFYPATIHGVSSFFTSFLSGTRKFLLTVWLALCIAVCLYEFSNTFMAFLSFSVKTRKELVEIGAEGVNFPAITFCSASAVRRTVVGGAPFLRTPVIIMATGITDPGKLDQMGQMCTADTTATEVTNLLTILNGSLGLATLMQTQVDSIQSVVDCKWNNKNINCGQSFINKATDAGFCFTFNPSLDILRTYELNANAIKANYGMTSSDWKLYISKSTGPKSGFSVVLLSNTTEYCASYLGYGGFLATVHDPMSEPLTLTKKGINLSPGWHANVAIKLTRTDRRPTESLGYCKSRLELPTFKDVVDYTSRDYFILDCLTKQIAAECQCVPFYAPRGNIYFYSDFPSGQFPNTNRSIMFTCGWMYSNNSPQIICQKSVENRELRFDGHCYLNAPKPCEETQISTETTASIWPDPLVLPHLKRKIRNSAEMTLIQFQQQFISANFFFDDYRYVLVTVSPKMTWVDLMNQLGGAMGMTVGLSIIGVAEFLVWILTRPIVLFRIYYSNATQTQLHTVQSYVP